MKSYLNHTNNVKIDRLYWNLSTGQVNDAFKNLGMAVPNDISQYINNSGYEGSQGQDALMQSLNPQAYQQYQTKQSQQTVTDAANNAQTQFNNLLNTDNSSITGFLSQYKGDVGNAVQNANSTFQLPQLAGTVDSLNNRINDLENNTSNSGGGAEAGTGLGGYATEGQVGAELNSRELPQYNAAVQNLGTNEGLAQQMISNELAPDQAYSSLLATNIQTSMSGLTATEQNVLNGAIANLNAGVTLETTQLNNAEQLAQTVLNNATSTTNAKLQQQYQTLFPGQQLYEVGANGTANKIAGTTPTIGGSGSTPTLPAPVPVLTSTNSNSSTPSPYGTSQLGTSAQNYLNYLTSTYGV